MNNEIVICKKNSKFITILLFCFIIFLLSTCVGLMIFSPTVVIGISMSPTIEDNDVVFINKIDKKIHRSDIIVFYYNGKKLIKRVIAINGDVIEIKDGTLTLNKEFFCFVSKEKNTNNIWEIGENEFFVIGDNVENSDDSRYFGKVSSSDVIGKIII